MKWSNNSMWVQVGSSQLAPAYADLTFCCKCKEKPCFSIVYTWVIYLQITLRSMRKAKILSDNLRQLFRIKSPDL